MEITVGVRELKTQLSAHLKQVKAGRALTITEYGKPIGRIIPVGQTTPNKKIRRMIESGFGSWSGRRLQPLDDQDLIKLDPATNITLTQLVLENRD
jgi:prevent-host-death family protein